MIMMGHFDYTVSEVNSHSSWSLSITHMEPLFYGAHTIVPNFISDIHLNILFQNVLISLTHGYYFVSLNKYHCQGIYCYNS
jgi:hypothetical protein